MSDSEQGSYSMVDELRHTRIQLVAIGYSQFYSITRQQITQFVAVNLICA